MMVHPWHCGSPWLAHTSTGLHVHDLHSVHCTWHFTTLYDIMLNYALHYTLLCEPQLSPTCTTVLHYWPLSIYLDCTAKARQRTALVNLPFQLVTSSCLHRFVLQMCPKQSKVQNCKSGNVVEFWWIASSQWWPHVTSFISDSPLFAPHLFPQIHN